ncbi:MAG: helix-turn-helix transcriptional regulator [SAR324 cluster bacterium]|nr:helix-turn-helix transcriptional regulator [SAR324 cluster bacterium]
MDIRHTLTKLDTFELVAIVLMIEKELSKRLDDEEDFNDYLEEFVAKSGVDNFEMAKRTNISRQALKGYLNGNRLPSLTILKKIVEATSLPLHPDLQNHSETAFDSIA